MSTGTNGKKDTPRDRLPRASLSGTRTRPTLPVTGRAARRVRDASRPRPEGLRGIQVVKQYTERTGKTLPHEFWTFYADWCHACSAGDQAAMAALSAHPNVALYSNWIDEVKRVLAAN